ncbi:glycosyltransferase [Paenibacillus oenotherae]|uniref:Glycosyltransferase n=1 Tax=Paenibacillus oenotherae TaxID=1435645 RepID=A0ABS7DD63_9BACL|nr:glycosyltransferase [Paenibacillus oenotherae]MBW7477098.1 glycosyltransferase [Paenibacillus oenotherae]
MKILFSYFVPSGGVETMNRLRCHALRRAGIECHLLYSRDGAGRQNIKDIPLFITDRDDELSTIIHANQYDIIVTICDHLMLRRLRGLGYQGKLIYEAQGLGSMEQAGITLSNAVPYIRQYASGAITHETPHLMGLFNSYLSDFPRFYVQNIVDTELFRYRPTGMAQFIEQPIVAWIGRIERNKNWRLFLQIGSVLLYRYPKLQLWMFEDANIYEEEERGQFEGVVRRLALVNHLIVRSNVPHAEMPHYLSSISDSGGMLISTSNVESFGYAAAEAISCRCPVLSTDSEGIRSSIIHNVTGKFFHAGTPNDAAYEAIELIENKTLRERIQAQGEQYIRTTYSADRYIADFHNIMRTLCAI